MKTAIILLLLTFSQASVLHAEIAIGFTAEWLSHESSMIAVATPVDVRTIESSDHFPFTKCRYRLDEIIKGPVSVGDTVTVFDASGRGPDALSLGKARKAGTQLLVFATVGEHIHKQVDGKYVLVQTPGLNARSAHFGNQAVDNLYTPDFQPIVKFEELLLRVRAQAIHESELNRQYWQGEVKKKSLEVPFDSKAYKQLYAGSACYLWVPVYIKRDDKTSIAKP